MLKTAVQCEDNGDYFDHLLANQLKVDQPQTHNEGSRQQVDEEGEGDSLEPTECTGDSGYSGSGTNYITIPIFVDNPPQNSPSHS